MIAEPASSVATLDRGGFTPAINVQPFPRRLQRSRQKGARTPAGVIYESPAAYKDIGAVMAAQSDLVTIRHRLRQVVNVKG